MNQFGDAIGWPTRDPGWITKVILMGLISLIPIVGQMVLFGWMLGALDNLRAGRQELPPVGFSYLGRGATLFVVMLLYALGFCVLFGIFFVLGGVIAAAGGNSEGGGSALGAIGGLIVMVGWLVMIVAMLGLYLLFPAIIVNTERGGIGGGLNVPQVIAFARTNASATVMAGLMTVLAYVIGSLGSFLCGIGVILTLAYGYAMLAGVVRVYEQQVGMSPAAPYQPPLPPATPA